MWLKLLKINSLRDALTPRLVKGRWHSPLISGRNKAFLRRQFREAGVPWVFDSPSDPNKSAYNRVPKKIYKEFDQEEKLLQIRASLKKMDDMIDKYREERIQKKPLKGFDRALELALPIILK